MHLDVSNIQIHNITFPAASLVPVVKTEQSEEK